MTPSSSSLDPPAFFKSGGTLEPNAPSYVVRQADAELYTHLQQGEFCYVLTSRQMGKRSLIVQTTVRLRKEGVGVVVIDLALIGQNLPAGQRDGARYRAAKANLLTLGRTVARAAGRQSPLRTRSARVPLGT